jgi:hypothetical protein
MEKQSSNGEGNIESEHEWDGNRDVVSERV